MSVRERRLARCEGEDVVGWQMCDVELPKAGLVLVHLHELYVCVLYEVYVCICMYISIYFYVSRPSSGFLVMSKDYVRPSVNTSTAAHYNGVSQRLKGSGPGNRV